MKTYAELFNYYKKDKLEPSALKMVLKETLAEYKLDYYLNQKSAVKPSIKRILDLRVKKLKRGIPAQYILGYTYFYGIKLKVNKNVLIPRFDTEVLVEAVLKEFNHQPVKMVDIGTGSGAIAIALKINNPKAIVLATDISTKALSVARVNIKNSNKSIKLLIGDLLTPLIMKKIKVDVIISNPPYIGFKDKKVDQQVKLYEPKIALFSQENGLWHLKQILKDANKILNQHGTIFLEIGHQQARPIIKYAKSVIKNLDKITVIKDLSGLNRLLKVKIK